MPKRLLAHHAIARQFALGIALAGLMLAFMAASLLVFPYKATANPDVQGELLYDLLGHLQYGSNDRFAAVDDPAMQQRLDMMLMQNRLNTPTAAAYIVNLATGERVWSASASPLRFDAIDTVPDSGYAMQFIDADDHQLAVQNFWIKDAGGIRHEFRMVLALPTN